MKGCRVFFRYRKMAAGIERDKVHLVSLVNLTNAGQLTLSPVRTTPRAPSKFLRALFVAREWL